tara:strand:- start:1966 stop:2172 length:207 start_codon:yes stop_codon:yes gene_type:complete
MKSITTIIKNIKNLLPYFLLIAIYFFFINIEARKSKHNNIKEKNIIQDNKVKVIEKNLKIRIPVIPFE